MTYNSNAFWNGFAGCMFAAFILLVVVLILGAAIDHGRFMAAQECIAASQTDEGASACLQRWNKDRRR